MTARDEVDTYVDESEEDGDLELPPDAPDELKHLDKERKDLNESSHRFAFASKRWWGLLSAFWAFFWFISGAILLLTFGLDIVALGVGFLVLCGLAFSVGSTINYLVG